MEEKIRKQSLRRTSKESKRKEKLEEKEV